MVIMEYKAVMYFFSGYAVCVTDANDLHYYFNTQDIKLNNELCEFCKQLFIF
jgi:hypothetical protein